MNKNRVIDTKKTYNTPIKDFDEQDPYFYKNESPLSRSCELNHYKCVKLLLYYDANPNISIENKNDNSLIRSASMNNIDCLKAQLEYGGDPNLVLDYAVSNKPDILKLLINYGADPNLQMDISGNTPIIKSCKRPYKEEAIKVLLEAGADPDIKNKDGKSAWNFAKRTGCYNILGKKFLAEHKKQISIFKKTKIKIATLALE